MLARTVLSIDGRSGADLVLDPEAHLHGSRFNPDQSLSSGSNGKDGVHAPLALSGEPAAAVAVEISRSQLREGGIMIKVLGELKDMRSPLPPTTEIPPRTNVHFTAIGGKGEPGRKGGPGDPGSPGQNGTDATREVRGTDGGDGGVGGIGGRGSNGGRGGPGGKILIYIDEDQTELLHAVTWDVSGGKGGEAGQHGAPGEGGKGGKGGEPQIWQDVSDYKYNCTPSCIGGSTDVALLPSGRDPVIDILRRVATMPSTQSLVGNTLVRAASAVNRIQGRKSLGGEVCVCKGGSTHCPGCEEIPIYRTLSKPGGKDGAAGAKGAERLDQLSEGEVGDTGSVEITVRHKDGGRPKYSSVFKLALTSFDVEDCKASGIFEPGEDILIRHIRIRNKGGMPSPLCSMPCELISSDLIECTVGEERQTDLPNSISPGNLAFAKDGLRGRISIPKMTPKSPRPYVSEQKIGLRAVVPWLQQPLDEFHESRTIKVQFPLELRHIKVPSALAPRFGHLVRWEILNKTNLSFGSNTDSARAAKVSFRVDPKQCEIIDSAGNWVSSLNVTVPTISARGIIEMSQRVRVKPGAITYSDLEISLQLFISAPNQGPLPVDLPISGLQLIESHKVHIQVAPGHTQSEDDRVLLVTNPATRKTELEAIKQYLETKLFLKTNVWNIGIYGGLLTHDPNEDSMLESIIQAYAGKLVIFLGNRFLLSDGEAASVLKVCDYESIRAACAERTSCLFFGFNNDPSGSADFDDLLRPIQDDAATAVQLVPRNTRFQKADDLIKSIQQTRGEASRYHLLAVSKSKLRNGVSNLNHAAKKLAKSLREEVPHIHFVICPNASQASSGAEDGDLLVWRGLARTFSLEATPSDLFMTTSKASVINLTSQGLQREMTLGRKSIATLTAYDQFCILSSVPMPWRLELLRRTQAQPLTADTVKLIGLSLTIQVDEEIQRFLAETKWPNSVDVEEDKFLEDSLPSVHQLISSVTTAHDPSPELLSIVLYCLASSRPQSTKEAVSQNLLPFGHRRKQLFKRITKAIEGTNRGEAGRKRLAEALRSHRGRSSRDSAAGEQRGLKVLEGRCVSSSLTAMVNEMTGKSQYFQNLARYGVSHALEENDILNVNEWDARVQRSREHMTELLRLFTRFQEEQERYGHVTDDIEPGPK